jgi:hypothetical protein
MLTLLTNHGEIDSLGKESFELSLSKKAVHDGGNNELLDALVAFL